MGDMPPPPAPGAFARPASRPRASIPSLRARGPRRHADQRRGEHQQTGVRGARIPSRRLRASLRAARSEILPSHQSRVLRPRVGDASRPRRLPRRLPDERSRRRFQTRAATDRQPRRRFRHHLVPPPRRGARTRAIHRGRPRSRRRQESRHRQRGGRHARPVRRRRRPRPPRETRRTRIHRPRRTAVRVRRRGGIPRRRRRSPRCPLPRRRRARRGFRPDPSHPRLLRVLPRVPPG